MAASVATQQRSAYCECGNVRDGKYCCSRCALFDGVSQGTLREIDAYGVAFEVIHYLRENPGRTAGEIAATLRKDFRQIAKVIKKLVVSGRVCRQLDNFYEEEAPKRGHFRVVYFLTLPKGTN